MCPAGRVGLRDDHSDPGSDDVAAEADIVISKQLAWALSQDTCLEAFRLEAVVTHEAGHVFGLDHVSEAKHPDLTMSTTINDFCDNSVATLGLGDMLGLESLYAANPIG